MCALRFFRAPSGFQTATGNEANIGLAQPTLRKRLRHAARRRRRKASFVTAAYRASSGLSTAHRASTSSLVMSLFSDMRCRHDLGHEPPYVVSWHDAFFWRPSRLHTGMTQAEEGLLRGVEFTTVSRAALCKISYGRLHMPHMYCRSWAFIKAET